MTTSQVLFPRVFVITLNWNRQDDTLECLASLRGLNYPNFAIIVVDNGSTDGSVRALKSQYPDMTVIENGRNLGYAEGLNVGLRYAFENGADYFLILNSDTAIDSEALLEMVRVAQQDEKIGFVCGKVYWYANPNTLQMAGRDNHPVLLVGPHVGSGEVDCGQFNRVQDYDFADDVCLLVRREVYETIGGYDCTFLLYYAETDWCVRLRRAGFRIVYTPTSKIWHKGIIGDGNVTLSPSRIFSLQRDQIAFMWRNASRRQWEAYLGHLLLELPYWPVHYAKHGRFGAMFSYLKGFACGMFWLWQNRHVTGQPSRSEA